MKTEEMDREDLTAALAKKLKMREDGIDALELDMSELRSDYDRVKYSNYWNGGYYGSIVVAVMGVHYGIDGALLPAVAGVAAGLAGAYVCESKQLKCDAVKNNLKRQTQLDLVDLDREMVTARKGRNISEEDLVAIIGIHNQSIRYDKAVAVCDIDESRLTDMYNTASKAKKIEKWAAPVTLASLVTATAMLFGFDNTVVHNIGMASMLSFFVSAGVGAVQGRKISRVENELQDAMTDRLIELKDQKSNAPQL